MTETNYANSKDDLQPVRCGECDQVIAGTLYCFNCIQVLKEKLLAPPSTSAAIRAAAEEIAREFQLEKPGWVTLGRIKIDPETETEIFERTSETATDRVWAILSRYFGKGEAEKSEPGEESFEDLGMTICGACQGRHPIPRNAAQQAEMGCKGRWYFADAATPAAPPPGDPSLVTIDAFRGAGNNVTLWCTPRAVVVQIAFHDDDAEPDIDKSFPSFREAVTFATEVAALRTSVEGASE